MRHRIIVAIGVVAGLLLAVPAGAEAAPAAATGTQSWVTDVLPNEGITCGLGAFITNLGTAPGTARIDLWWGVTKAKLTGPPRQTLGPQRVTAGSGIAFLAVIPNRKLWRIQFTGTAPGGKAPLYVENRFGQINQPGCSSS